ncbi:MAG TPA: hypothetical protein V6D22_00950 [Candidatus Obscuribacterales bacterium]
MKIHRQAIIVVAAMAAVSCMPALAKSGSKRPVARTPQTDTVVTKNPDGTIEVSDQPAPSSPGITYHAAPPGVVHYADGVTVHRNADGSVDVSDDNTPEYHSFGPAPAPVHHKHATAHSGTHPAVKPAAKKTK